MNIKKIQQQTTQTKVQVNTWVSQSINAKKSLEQPPSTNLETARYFQVEHNFSMKMLRKPKR